MCDPVILADCGSLWYGQTDLIFLFLFFVRRYWVGLGVRLALITYTSMARGYLPDRGYVSRCKLGSINNGCIFRRLIKLSDFRYPESENYCIILNI
jgi:hypothetical protein